MISIITATFRSYDFLDLLADSLARFTRLPYELVVIDNGPDPVRFDRPHARQFVMPTNVGHGPGLNEGVRRALALFPDHPYVTFLDVDCHALADGWEAPLVARLAHADVVAGRGPPSKPVRPACMAMRAAVAGRYDWADTPGFRGNRVTPGGYDVACRAYHDMVADGLAVEFLDPLPNRYGTRTGEEWGLGGVPLVYHHWHGSHLPERQADFPDCDLQAEKARLFSRVPWRLP